MKTVPSICNSEVGVTPGNSVTGKESIIAEVFPARSAISAVAIRPTKPRDTYTIADREVRRCVLADLFHSADDLVTQNQWQFRVRQFASHHMKVGAANRARVDAHEQLSPIRLWFWHGAQLQGLLRPVENHRAHSAKYRSYSCS